MISLSGTAKVLLSALSILCIASAAPAQPIVSPPAEMLAPLTYDFQRPGPPISPGDTWEALTQGTNLALGAPYRFDRKPNYGPTKDAGDATQLTDGKLVPGDRIWYSKDAVGYVSCDPPATVSIDLGQVQPIGSVVVRCQGGGAHEASLRYPIRFDIFVSDDDRTYHRVDSVMKRQYADQRGAFYDLPEAEGNFPPGNPKPHAFNFGNLSTRGRYVAVRMAFAGAYNALDEIAVMKGTHDPQTVTFDPAQAATVAFDGVELWYPRDWLQVPIEVATGFSVAVRDARADTSGPVTFKLSLPQAVKLSWSGDEPLQERPHQREGRDYVEYALTLPGTRSELRYFYLHPLYARPLLDGRMYFHAETPDRVQPEQSVRLLQVSIPAAPLASNIFFALGWTGLAHQMNWPDAPEALRALGLSHASVGSWEMPSVYQQPETAAGQQWLDKTARGAGMQVCLTDSPFHIMEALWGKEPDFAEAYAQVEPPVKRLCPAYSGKYFQREVQRLVERYRYRKAEVIFFDIECFGHAKQHVQECGRCKPLLGDKDPVTLASELLAARLREIRTAIDAAADELGRPHAKLGIYHASPAYNYHNVLDFSMLYPEIVQFDNPEVYCRAWPPAVAEIIRSDKALLPPDCPIIAWVSPGTLNWEGEAPPGRFFDALMQLFCNGAMGAAYYTPWNLCTGDLLAQAQAVRIMLPVQDMLTKSELCDTKNWVQGEVGSASAVRAGDEMLALVADYRHLGDQEVTVRVPVEGPAEVVDLMTRQVVGKLTPERSELTVKITGAYRSRPLYIGTRWAEREVAVPPL